MRISDLYLIIKDYIANKQKSPPHILNAFDTIKMVQDNNLSISRYGDGEFDLMLNINHPKYQKTNTQLHEKLWETFSSKNSKLLVCIPDVFEENSLDKLTRTARKHWLRFVRKNRLKLYDFFDTGNIYGDSLVTRHYMDIEDKTNSEEYFNLIKKLWKNREVIVVEGRYTRFGVGNDLLSETNSIKRILCPECDAFAKYDIILKTCRENASNEDVLFLLALGPTATVLAYDLTDMGFQAIDIGHLDIEYEWFLSHANKKIKVENKYVNETDDIITEGTDSLKNEEYNSSIICKIF